MAKKNYKSPKCKFVPLKFNRSLLAGSDPEVGFEGGIPADAKRAYGSFAWDEDDEY